MKQLFLLVIGVACYCLSANADVFIISVPPVDTVGCYGGLSTFYCESNRTDIIHMHWTIDGSTLTDRMAQLRGISTDATCTVNSNHSCLFLHVFGSKTNSNIKFGCVFAIKNGSTEIASALYTVLDTLPPVTNFTCVDNSISMNCSWSQPFCKPVNYSYSVVAYTDSEEILQEKLMNTHFSMNTTPCSNYKLNVFVVNIAEPSAQSNSSTVTVISGFNEMDISFSLVQDQTSFSSITKSSVSIFYKCSLTGLSIVSNCLNIQFLQFLPVPEFLNSFNNSLISKAEFFESYNKSTGIGNYTIGSFNKSFIGYYTLTLINLTSMEPMRLAKIQISTFHVQEATIIQLSNGSIEIMCGFAINSAADGCSVVFVNTQSHDQNETLFIPKGSNMNTVVPPGKYSVSVYDVINSVTQTSTPAVTTLYTHIDPTSDPVMSNEVLTLSSSTTIPLNVLSSTVHSVFFTPSITQQIVTTQGTATIPLNLIIRVSLIVEFLILLLLLVTAFIMVCLICWRCSKRLKRNNHYCAVVQNNTTRGEQPTELDNFHASVESTESIRETAFDDDNTQTVTQFLNNRGQQSQISSSDENCVPPQQEDLSEDVEGHSHDDVQSSNHSSVTSSNDDNVSHMQFKDSKYFELHGEQKQDDHGKDSYPFNKHPAFIKADEVETDKVNVLEEKTGNKDSLNDFEESIEFKLSSVMILGAPGAGKTTYTSSGTNFESSSTDAIGRFLNSESSGFQVLGDDDMLRDRIKSYADNERPSPFIKVYDCGDQFQARANLFHLLHRNPSLVNIVVIRLIDNLDDKHTVCTEDGGCHQLNCLTNREHIIRMCQIASNQYSQAEGVVPHVMIVGTHYDMLGESADAVLQKFNEALRSIKKEFGHVLICKSEDDREIIFPINAMATGDEPGIYIAQIQERIISTATKECAPVEVSFKWLLFQAAIKRKKSVVVNMTDCCQIGESLGLAAGDVKEAFQFLNKIADISYIPDDIPNFIIAQIHLLIDQMSSLFTAPLRSNELLDESEALRASGLFNKSYVGKILETDELSEEKLLEVLECLKIVACVGHGKYFFPSALSFEPNIDEASQFNISCYPLVFNWGEYFLPDGFFHVVANELLSFKENGKYKFELCGFDDVHQWRGQIQIRETGKISGVIKLKNKMKWIQVSSTTDNTKEDCPIIYGEVHAAIQKTLIKFKHMGIGQPTVTTLCLLCPSTQEDHCCILSPDKVMCSIDNNKTDYAITKHIFYWFKGQESVPYSAQLCSDTFEGSKSKGSEFEGNSNQSLTINQATNEFSYDDPGVESLERQ